MERHGSRSNMAFAVIENESQNVFKSTDPGGEFVEIAPRVSSPEISSVTCNVRLIAATSRCRSAIKFARVRVRLQKRSSAVTTSTPTNRNHVSLFPKLMRMVKIPHFFCSKVPNLPFAYFRRAYKYAVFFPGHGGLIFAVALCPVLIKRDAK